MQDLNVSYELSRDIKEDIYIERSPYFVALPHFHQQVEILYVFEGSVQVTVNGQKAILRLYNDMMKHPSTQTIWSCRTVTTSTLICAATANACSLSFRNATSIPFMLIWKKKNLKQIF